MDMSEELKVSVCQMTSVDELERNLQQIEGLIASVPAAEAVRLFCFPENCLYLRVVEGEPVPSFQLADPVFAKLGKIARKRKAFLHLGSVPLQMGSGVYNASVIISDEGKVQTSYQKIHLFDIQLTGQKAIRESDVFNHGPSTQSFEIDGWKIGQSICYDLRFSELYSQYALEGVDLILVPSAFLVKTGEAHWEVLLRARAIESQCYVVASAQAGNHVGTRGGSRQTYGHSLVVEPWGTLALHLGQDENTARVVTLSKSKIHQARQQIPMAQHRRISR
jgi:predicted amidohydrolase